MSGSDDSFDPASESGTPPPGACRIAITIVTYDSPPELLEQCVARVLATIDRADCLVVVADTGGAAARRLQQAGLADGVEVIDLGANAGFAAGLDVGFAAGLDRGAETLVSLNDDVLVEPGWLAPLVEALAAERVGAVQPVLVQLGTEPPTINSAGVAIDRHGAGSDRLRGSAVADATATELAAVTGGAAAWSAAFVRDVGPIDQRFFLYYEDVEWCRRGAARGWTYRLVPASRVLHAGSASTHRLGDSLRWIQERNRLWTVAMHGSVRETIAAWSLSLRRLRHEPRDVHRRALLDGTRGAAGRWIDRVRTRRADAAATPAPATIGAPDALRRPVTGVNVLGYHHISSGLGETARTIASCLRAAGVDVVEIDNDLSSSPRRRPARPEPATRHPITIAVVTAFEFEGLVARTPWLREPGHRLIAYWMWELEDVPPSHRSAMGVLDEVWAATTFVRDAYAAVAPGHVPVRKAPYQLAWPPSRPEAAATWRARWGGRFTFLVTFDYLSIPERKNPLAAIRAFAAVADQLPGDLLLVVKSMNGEKRPEAMAEVAAAIAGRDDVIVVDEHLDDDDHHGLIDAADCLVSPHRSEGFGIQPLIALGLGTPVIATRYGGVLDFLDDHNSRLVEAGRIGVIDGEGIYPVGAEWADIDHDGLVDAMRRVATDENLRSRLIAAGRTTVAAWPDDATVGAGYRSLLERAEPRTTSVGDLR